HHLLPDIAAARLYDNWKALVPTLVDVHLDYMSRTMGKPLDSAPSIMYACCSQKCALRWTPMICLFFDH
ncbi:uncharacterized protein EDB91DRAFT_1024513, partial [Suillus paluster]|uniref:uncharacterized protein n=1 Tax=Suillus paluster TaxID=48578 RepID=UPI001B87F423